MVLVHGAEVKLQDSFYAVASLQSSTRVLLLHYKAVHMCCCFTTKQYTCAVASQRVVHTRYHFLTFFTSRLPSVSYIVTKFPGQFLGNMTNDLCSFLQNSHGHTCHKFIHVLLE